MGYKLICTDMDGTLLDKNFSIPKENIEAIKKAIEKGVSFALVTGRPYNVAKYFKTFLEKDVYIIGTNGTYFEVNKNIYKRELNELQLEKIYNVTKKYNLQTHFKGKQILISNGKIKKDHPYKKVNENLDIQDRIKIIEDADLKILLKEHETNVLKAIAFSDDLEAVHKAKMELKKDEGLEIASSGERNFEVMPAGTSKGIAVSKLAEYLGIDKKDIMCIGDNENDLSMIKYAGLGVAVSNAIDDVKRQADYVTDSNINAGVAKVINKFILEK